MKKLTLKDLLSCENTGWGYVGHSVREPQTWVAHEDPYACVKACDMAVLNAANVLGMSRKRLHTFMQSRPARHLGDFMEGNLQVTQLFMERKIMSFMKAFELCHM